MLPWKPDEVDVDDDNYDDCVQHVDDNDYDDGDQHVDDNDHDDGDDVDGDDYGDRPQISSSPKYFLY